MVRNLTFAATSFAAAACAASLPAAIIDSGSRAGNLLGSEILDSVLPTGSSNLPVIGDLPLESTIALSSFSSRDGEGFCFFTILAGTALAVGSAFFNSSANFEFAAGVAGFGSASRLAESPEKKKTKEGHETHA